MGPISGFCGAGRSPAIRMEVSSGKLRRICFISLLACRDRSQTGAMPRVTIGEGSWIGKRAVVMADVGRHCIVGAGAVVTKPIPDYAIAMGVPARVQRFRKPAESRASATNELATAGTA